MNRPKCLATLIVAAGFISQLAFADTFSFTSNLAIPDGQPAGVSDVETISSSVSQITTVWVSLDITGDFNGDLYCYLQHSNALSVLLNRAGRMANNPFGYADSGFDITLADVATNGNIHMYQGVVTPAAGAQLTGMWQPDGRTSSPATALDTNPSTAGLSVFDSLNASGSWTLFIADLSPGGTSELVSWQLIINPVPEPSVLGQTIIGLAVLTGFARVHKRLWN